MKNYEAKFNYLFRRQGGMCAIAYEYESIAMPTDLHHRCHNTKWRRKKFPLFLDSMLNLVGVSNHYHLKHPSWGKISDRRAGQYEMFLQTHPGICEFVNNPPDVGIDMNEHINAGGIMVPDDIEIYGQLTREGLFI